MVEVPEHLLKRSRERRSALGLEGGETPADERSSSESRPEEQSTSVAAEAKPGAATPAPTAPAPATEAQPEPPQPLPAYVQAAEQRRRLPWWSVPVFAALPLWAWIFLRTLSPAPVEADPLQQGQEAYQTCAGCHGGTGQGGSAPQLTDGAVLETWPDYRDHMMWVKVGASDWPSDTYGAQDNTHTGVMPSYATWSDEEIAQVVLYERQLSGEEIAEEDDLFLIAEGELTTADVGLGRESEEVGFTEADLEGP